MKNLIFILLFLSTSLLAQVKPSRADQLDLLEQILKEDDTNEQKYIMGVFTCNEYALRLYLQRSNRLLSEAYDFEGFEKDSGVPFQTLEAQVRLPLLYVSMAHHESKFYHAINAVLINQDAPEDISSYVFIEPQRDLVFQNIMEVDDYYRTKYYKNSNAALEIKISDVISYQFSGYVYQSRTKEILKMNVEAF